jgi:hypothetical protein
MNTTKQNENIKFENPLFKELKETSIISILLILHISCLNRPE